MTRGDGKDNAIVERLSGGGSVACVIGNPVRHSLSPAIHNAAFVEARINASYIAIEVEADEFDSTIDALKSLDFLGASITMPYKERAFGVCASVGDVARRLGSLNTLVPGADGLHGDSTDGQGCVGALLGAGVDLEGKRVVVVGAGATARACIVALSGARVSDIAVLNRTPQRAVEAVSLASDVARVAAESDLVTCDIIINTTPTGMGDNRERAFDYSLITARHAVLDAVYQPLETDLLATARRAGAVCVDGLWMLVHQAIAQQVLWTGIVPDAQVMRVAAERELERRRG